jgi:HlyD family secretion protein
MKSSDSSEDLAKIVHGARTHPLRKWIIGGVLLAVATGGIVSYRQSESSKDTGPTFVTEKLKRGDLSVTITATGNLQPTNKVTVGSELSGTALEVFVDSNDLVKKGQQLVRLDESKLAQQTDSARAALEVAKAKVNQTEATEKETSANLERLMELQRLSGGRTPAKADIDTAIASLDRAKADKLSAQASVSQAEAVVKSNESDLVKAIIRSPVDGVVLTRSIEVGQTVAAQFNAPELFVIAEDLKTMQLQVAIAEADIGKVDKGQTASFVVDAWPGRSYSAGVTKVAYGSVVTDNVVTYQAELEVSNSDLSLRPGMTATADIQTAGRKDVLLVPAAALRFTPRTGDQNGGPKKSFIQSLMPGPPRRGFGGAPPPADAVAPKPGEGKVWVLRDGHPQPVNVHIGITDGKHTEVTGDDLKEGMEVITRQSTATPS